MQFVQGRIISLVRSSTQIAPAPLPKKGIKAGIIAQYICQGAGRPGFNPRSRHTKDFKNDIWYLLA